MCRWSQRLMCRSNAIGAAQIGCPIIELISSRDITVLPQEPTMRILVCVFTAALCAAPAYAQSSQGSGASGVESARGGSQMISEGVERIVRGDEIEGRALFGSGVVTASVGASVATAGSAAESAGRASSPSTRDWSKPLRVGDETVRGQAVPHVPFEPNAPQQKPSDPAQQPAAPTP